MEVYWDDEESELSSVQSAAVNTESSCSSVPPQTRPLSSAALAFSATGAAAAAAVTRRGGHEQPVYVYIGEAQTSGQQRLLKANIKESSDSKSCRTHPDNGRVGVAATTTSPPGAAAAGAKAPTSRSTVKSGDELGTESWLESPKRVLPPALLFAAGSRSSKAPKVAEGAAADGGGGPLSVGVVVPSAFQSFSLQNEEVLQREAAGEEVEQQLRSLDLVLQQLQAVVDATTKDPQQAAFVAKQRHRQVQRLVQQATTTLAALDLELRSVASSLSQTYRSELLQRRQRQQQQLHLFETAFEDAVLSASVKQLTAFHAADEATDVANAAAAAEGSGVVAGRETLLRLGDDVQDKTQAALHRTKQMVAETEEMGGQVLQKMQQHTEQLQRAGGEITEVDMSLNRARKTAIVLARNAAGDRFTQCLCLFIFVFLIIAIVLICVPRGR